MLLAYTPGVLDELEVARRVATIRQRLIAAMKTGKVSQNTLEVLSGIDQPTISRIINGSVPELPTLIRLLDGLGIRFAEFFADIESRKDLLLKPTVALDDNRASLSQSGGVTHAQEADHVAHAAEQFAAHLVAFVRRELAASEQPAPGARSKRQTRRRGIHRR